jgi:HD-GYP domain-containing protein (c-di-GMP phosphodiesterase class II)
MKAIPVAFLREGLVFSEPVYIEGENLLVPAGVAIRKKDLERLVAWDIETVYSDGEPVSPSPAEGTGPSGKAPAAAQPSRPGGVPPEAYRGYLDLIRRLDSIFADIGASVPVDSRSVDGIAGELLQGVLHDRDLMVGYILGGEVKGQFLAKSSVNTGILSVLIALDLKFTNYRALQLVTGALLHDAGMLRLPADITSKRGGLSAEEIRQMQTHPVLAYRIVREELGYPEEVGLIALQHHEHWDGQGYPRRLGGANIDTGARIVSVTDAFEAMVSQRSYRNSMAGYQAMKNLLSDNSRRFDPEILKTFVKVMGVYPIGSVVLLNNGAAARVVDVQGKSPLRPKICLLTGDSGANYPLNGGPIIDLLTEKSLFITRALTPRDLSPKNA